MSFKLGVILMQAMTSMTVRSAKSSSFALSTVALIEIFMLKLLTSATGGGAVFQAQNK